MMKIRTIEASGSGESLTPIGMHKWRGLRLVAEITDSEDDEKCTMELREKLEKLLSIDVINEPKYEFKFHPSGATSIPIQSIDRKAIDDLEIAIDNCISKDQLEKLYDEAERLGCQNTYMNKMISFV